MAACHILLAALDNSIVSCPTLSAIRKSLNPSENFQHRSSPHHFLCAKHRLSPNKLNLYQSLPLSSEY